MKRISAMAGALLVSIMAAAQPPAGQQPGQPGRGSPGGGRGMMATPRAGVCPLPILPALPGYADTAFFAKNNASHGRVEQANYKN